MSLAPPCAPNKVRVLSEKHRAEFHASGLTDATIEAAGIYTARNSEIAKLLDWQPKHCNWDDGWVVPYDGTYSRVKLDYPRHGNDGKPIKYESPYKSGNRAYFAILTINDIQSADVIFVTEGEKKTLAVQQLGYRCIGLVGVWGWQKKLIRNDLGVAISKREMIDDLAAISWKGKRVYLLFDSDAATNTLVQQAEAMLADMLVAAGAEVFVCRIPANGGSKVGIDDYLMQVPLGERPARISGLMHDAKPAEKPAAPSPSDWAERFVQHLFSDSGRCELQFWRDEFFRWTGTHYRSLAITELRSRLMLPWLRSEWRKVRPKDAAEVVEALKSVCCIPFDGEAPRFLGNAPAPATSIIAFNNGLLDISNIGGDLALHPLTAEWFSFSSLPFAFDAEAECPRWLETLADWFNGDAECIGLLQRWFGLCLVPDTKYQRILVLVGGPRSGKGTTIRVLQHILGSDAWVSPTLSSLPGDFGLWPLLGKSACIFPDAHISRRADGTAILEILKSISGEDAQTIHRKFLPALPGVRLGVRFIISTNELPNLNDPSMALASRLCLLPYPNDYRGREKTNLEEKLKAEAPGVINWALGGLCSLRAAGQFDVPGCVAGDLANYKRMTSPVSAFVEDVAEVTGNPDDKVDCGILYQRWKEWAAANGREPGGDATFGSHLSAACSKVRRVRQRGEDGRRYVYAGIRLCP